MKLHYNQPSLLHLWIHVSPIFPHSPASLPSPLYSSYQPFFFAPFVSEFFIRGQNLFEACHCFCYASHPGLLAHPFVLSHRLTQSFIWFASFFRLIIIFPLFFPYILSYVWVGNTLTRNLSIQRLWKICSEYLAVSISPAMLKFVLTSFLDIYLGQMSRQIAYVGMYAALIYIHLKK